MKRILILTLIFAMSLSCASAATVKLDKDTEMHPQGWMAGAVMFKGGTEVVLNDKGEVVSGVMQYNEMLRTAGRSCSGTGIWARGQNNTSDIYFRSALVVFNEQGEVIEGTIDGTTVINYSDISFKPGTQIRLNANGNVVKGTLNIDRYLRPVGWEANIKDNAGFVKYKAGAEITFNDKGEVTASK